MAKHEFWTSIRRVAPGWVIAPTAVAVLVGVALAGCATGSGDSNPEDFVVTATPRGPTAITSVPVTLTGSDTETCELIFAIGEAANGTVSEVIDQACEPGSPNTDSATVTFTADPDVCGPGEGSFTYTTNDGSATSAPATVTVDIPCIAIGVEGQ